MKIIFNKSIEDANRQEIEKYLHPFRWLIPAWMQNLHVNLWDGGEEGEVISIKVNYDYRFASMDFNCCWLNQSETDKQKTIIHELLHLSLCVLADYARYTFNLLCPKEEAEKFNKHILEELREKHESITQDLAFMILDWDTQNRTALKILETELYKLQTEDD